MKKSLLLLSLFVVLFIPTGFSMKYDMNRISIAPAEEIMTSVPDPAGSITGPATVCRNATGIIYSVAAIPGATGYSWTVPAGATITAGSATTSITVSFTSTSVSGNITVSGTNPEGSGPASVLSVTVTTIPLPTITGPNSVCKGASGVVYQTESGKTNYVWSCSFATITAGQGTNAVTITFIASGTFSMSVKYTDPVTGCTSNVSFYTIRIWPSSCTITTIGGGSPTQGQTYTYTTNTGFSNYQWSCSNAGVIQGSSTGESVNILWTVVTNPVKDQWVSVIYTNGGGCPIVPGTMSNFCVNVSIPPSLGGNITPCQGSTAYTYTTDNFNTNYIWTVSGGGTIISGGTSTSNTVTVNWNTSGAQTVSVSYTNGVNYTWTTPT
ncbi:MAG: hypothetical protein WCL00_08410, partial [Bacteroidota bacterium]